MKIIWDEAAYVDTGGTSHRIAHAGVKYVDINNPQPPSVIVRKGRIDETIFPTDYVHYDGGRYGRGWWHEPLLPQYSGGTATKLRERADQEIGKSIQVLLPLQIDGVVNDYLFVFKIKGAEVKQPYADKSK